MKALVKVLQPFDELTQIFSSSESLEVAALIAPRIISLVHRLQQESSANVAESFKEVLSKQVQKCIQITPALAMVSALHLSFNTLWFLEDDVLRKEALGMLGELFLEIVPLPPSPSYLVQAETGLLK